MEQESMVYGKSRYCLQRSRLWAIILITFVIILAYNIYLSLPTQLDANGQTALEELNTNVKEIDGILEKHFSAPNCANLLTNITQGMWKGNDDADKQLSDKIKEIHRKYRLEVGIPLQPWREDKNCGFQMKAKWVTTSWPQTASFCNPEGDTPCCTNSNKGRCVAMDANQRCDCARCVNTRDYKEALLAHWTTKDSRCGWKKYTALEACAILNKLSSRRGVAELHFVGDSLIRNMFMGFATILTSGLTGGIKREHMSKEIEEMCFGENLFIFRRCQLSAVAYSLEQLARSKSICGGHRQFRAQFDSLGVPSKAQPFKRLIQTLDGKENVHLIMGVGLHYQCDHQRVIREFLEPAIKFLNYSKRTWPRLVWVHPLSVGLLKPPVYSPEQGDQAIVQFATKMEVYLQKHSIPVLDFRQVTKGVHSYDGTHYGAGVNIMKAQILLNYFATIMETTV